MLPTTLFIPLINNHTNDFELRYALRSWSKYSDIKTVLIIGHKPVWYIGDHISDDTLKSKTEDIFVKTLHASSVIDRLIFSNDDIILLKPLTELPYYYQSALAKFNGGSQTFMRYVDRTASLYPGGKYFDVHTPFVVESSHMLSLKYTPDTIMKSVYCNSAGIEGVSYKDVKINSHLRTEAIDELLADKSMFSFGDNGLNNDLRKWLIEKFPEPSIWECR